MRRLLSICELGYHADYSRLYATLGYHASRVASVRKGLRELRDAPPDVIVAEFVCTPGYSMRVSNLEPLTGGIQRYCPDAQLLVLYMETDAECFEIFREHHRVTAGLTLPVDEATLRAQLKALQRS